jgi:hypothetical protein
MIQRKMARRPCVVFYPLAEECEQRALLSVVPGAVVREARAEVRHAMWEHAAGHHGWRLVDRGHPLFKIHSDGHLGHSGGSPPSGALTPAETRSIYSFTGISNVGAGQTIANVDSYNDPNIFSDANTFDKQFATTLSGGESYYSAYGDSSSWLTQVYAQGSKPSTNAGWALEISLDVEWAHAIAPLAKIMLDEVASSSMTDLLGGNTYAAEHGATVVSNSWGSSESSGETA